MIDFVAELARRAMGREAKAREEAAAQAAAVAATEQGRRDQYVALVRALAEGKTAPLTPDRADELLIALGRAPERLAKDVETLRERLEWAREVDPDGAEIAAMQASDAYDRLVQGRQAARLAAEQRIQEEIEAAAAEKERADKAARDARAKAAKIRETIPEKALEAYREAKDDVERVMTYGGRKLLGGVRKVETEHLVGPLEASRSAWRRAVKRAGERADWMFA